MILGTHWRKAVVFVIKVLVPLVLGAIVSAFVFRPEVYAQFSCQPLEGPAPLIVECVNESAYETSVNWDFGDGSGTSTESGRVRHEYVSARAEPYTITLIAVGKGRDRNSKPVSVYEPEKIRNPQTVSLVANLNSAVERTSSARDVSFVNDNHSSAFGETTRDYVAQFQAEPGFKIVDVSFRASSQTRASGPSLNVSADGQLVTVSSRITAGPKIDRYRGWLHGQLELVQERESSAQDVPLAVDLEVVRDGLYPLDAALTLDSVRELRLAVDGRSAVSLKPGQTFSDPVNGVAYTVIERSGGLFLQVSSLD